MENIPVEINETLNENSKIDTTLLNEEPLATKTDSTLDDYLASANSKEELLARFEKIHAEKTATEATGLDTTSVETATKVDSTPVMEATAFKSGITTSPAIVDISDIPTDDSSVSAVLGNLDEEPVEESIVNEVNFGFDFNNADIDFSKEEIDDVEKSADEALSEETLTNSRNEEKYIYHSYSNNKVSARGSNPKLAFMDKITVDLNDITITNKSPIQQAQDINLVFNSNVATFTVICCQSGYTADMSGLTLAEKNAINNSNGDIFQMRQRLYKTVYNKIHSMSIPKPDFNNWLKITSFNDLSTLLFGIYCQTFIDNNEFDITCGKCEKTTSVTIDNQSLVEVRDRATYEKRDEIISSIKTGEELVAASIVHKDERVMLNDSKIIVDVSTPSLHDHLALLKVSNQQTLQEYADAFSAMLFISHMYMLDVGQTYNTGRATYYEVSDKAKLLNILLKLSSRDGEQLENAIEEKLGKYKIDYEIHNVTCSHCKSKLPGIPVDIETILFTRINRTNTAT